MRSRPRPFGLGREQPLTSVAVAQNPETLREAEGPQEDQSSTSFQPAKSQGVMQRSEQTMLWRKHFALQGLEKSRLDMNSKFSDR